MTRILAWIWLFVVVSALGYMVVLIHHGLPLRTDLLALLPREEQDPVLQRANDAVSRAVMRRVVVLVGHPSAQEARSAAVQLTKDLTATGLTSPIADSFGAEGLKRLGSLYFPYRRGLLAEADRQLLASGQAEEVATKALAQAFGVGGVANANLLRADPFLLLPSFFADLPLPLSRLRMEDGMLTVTDGGITWVLVINSLRGEPFALDVQERLLGAFESSVAAQRQKYPGLQIKRLGAVFFAEAGSRTAISEASTLATASIIGTILLIIVIFRRALPLLLNLLVVVVGISMALVATIVVFGELHVAALLFGTSLIGVSFDYGIFYTASIFDPMGGTSRERLHRVMPGIALGLVSALLGYGALALAPFPGLRQIAVFSVIGLLAAFATVALWLPVLDTGRPTRHGARLLKTASSMYAFWEALEWRRARTLLLFASIAIAIGGLLHFQTDNNVRRMQALSPELLRDQEEIVGLIGTSVANQFLLIEKPTDEDALQQEEMMAPILSQLKTAGALGAAQMPAAFVPSAARQRENQALVRTRLEEPLLARHQSTLGMSPVTDAPGDGLLTLNEALASKAVPLLDDLVLGSGLHVVALQGLAQPDAVRAAFAGMAGVRLVDPTADFSALLGKYQQRALALTGLSMILMFGAWAIRYGWKGAGWVMVPSVIAISLSPALLMLAGQSFTFFHVMALVLLLSITNDYAIFCAESPNGERPVTLLAVWMAALTTLLSFGLLALSQVPAVHNFGSIMLVGILLSFFSSPLASRGRQKMDTPMTNNGVGA